MRLTSCLIPKRKTLKSKYPPGFLLCDQAKKFSPYDGCTWRACLKLLPFSFFRLRNFIADRCKNLWVETIFFLHECRGSNFTTTISILPSLTQWDNYVFTATQRSLTTHWKIINSSSSNRNYSEARRRNVFCLHECQVINIKPLLKLICAMQLAGKLKNCA